MTKIARRSYSDYGTRMCSTHHISTHPLFWRIGKCTETKDMGCLRNNSWAEEDHRIRPGSRLSIPRFCGVATARCKVFLMRDTAWGRCIGGWLGGLGGRDRPCWQWGRLRAVMRGARYGAINRKIEARRLGKRRLAIENDIIWPIDRLLDCCRAKYITYRRELRGLSWTGSSILAVRQLRAGHRRCRKCDTDLVIGDQWPAGSGASWDTTVRITEGIL